MRERSHVPFPPRRVFLQRALRAFLIAMLAIAVSLGLGVLGYHVLGGLPWIDALLNASMILGGMGPVDTLVSPGAKLFASAYALFSGVILLASVAVMISPVLHRILHRYHLEADSSEGKE